MEKESQDHTNLILLTQRFPFLPGEQFLETEIQYLSKEFDTIHVLPIWKKTNDGVRKVPDNVIVHEVPNSNVFLKEFSNRFINFLFDHQGRQLFREDLAAALRKGPKAVALLVNWIGIAVRIRKVLQNFRQDMELDEKWVFYSYWLNQSALALKMLKEIDSNITIVSRAHGGDLYEYRQPPYYLPLQTNVVKCLDALFLISEDGYHYMHEKTGYSQDHYFVSRLGTKRVAKRSRASKDHVLRIVTCSRLHPVKRIPLLIEALKLCSIDIEWIHIGDGPLKNEIVNKAKELPDRIDSFFLGNLDNAMVIQEYQNRTVDVFINISKSEGIPVAVMEAMSCGIPVIATNVGGTSELVDDDTGMLLHSDLNAAELAAAIEKFAHLPKEKKDVMRENAYKKWESTCNAETNYRDFARRLKGLKRRDRS